MKKLIQQIRAELEASERAGGNEAELRHLRAAVANLVKLVEKAQRAR